MKGDQKQEVLQFSNHRSTPGKAWEAQQYPRQGLTPFSFPQTMTAMTFPQTRHSLPPSSFPHTEEQPSGTRRPAQPYRGSKPDSENTNKMVLPGILKEPYNPKLNLI